MASKKKFKLGINTLISWGASVVIVGLMFKILHWKGGEIMIAAGLITEAALFFGLGFMAEPEEVDWTRVYPELDKDFNGELPKSTVRSSGGGSNNSTAALDKMLSDAKIGPELIDSLGTGLRTFGDKVASISSVADSATATNEFTSKVKAASGSFDSLSSSFEKATASLREMADTGIDSKSYHDQVTSLTKNISALNAVYELELKESSQHLQSMKGFYGNLSATMANFNESMEDSKQFKDEVGKLAKNLASLNSIYGNMLSAMNQTGRA